ncbi:MAG: hypothetical protein JWN70_1378 [Planctomycetaceae bacterium]|nr:hypothetical protein [Planctomycetaceae bacterium]
MSTWLNGLQRYLVSPVKRKPHQRFGRGLEVLEVRQVLAVNPITVSAVSDISSTDGHVNAEVATFSDSDESASVHDFKAVIDWGDGKTSKGHVTAGAEGGFVVTGKHVYHVTGERQISVTVSDKSGNSATDGGFETNNLVSDQAGQAPVVDPNLVNAWGLALSPAGPFWINDNGTGVSTLVDGEGVLQSLVVTVPTPLGVSGPSAPTGMVFNGTADFAVTGGASHFIFSTEEGTISGWNNGTAAELKVDNSASGAIYKGLAIGSVGSDNFIYATDFHNGKIDVFDKNFAAVQPAGDFQVPKLQKGYAPFGIENINGTLFVTYAKQDADGVDDLHHKGWGFVAEFSTDGHYIKTLVERGPLNAPWGLAQAPDDFGRFSNDLLVGNFGDGTVDAFDPDTGDFLGVVTDTSGNPLTIDGLWAIKFGNGAAGGDTDDIYFTAGPDDESHGLFGELGSAGDPTHIFIGPEA